jgi:hypothetical protein
MHRLWDMNAIGDSCKGFFQLRGVDSRDEQRDDELVEHSLIANEQRDEERVEHSLIDALCFSNFSGTTGGRDVKDGCLFENDFAGRLSGLDGLDNGEGNCGTRTPGLSRSMERVT